MAAQSAAVGDLVIAFWATAAALKASPAAKNP